LKGIQLSALQNSHINKASQAILVSGQSRKGQTKIFSNLSPETESSKTRMSPGEAYSGA